MTASNRSLFMSSCDFFRLERVKSDWGAFAHTANTTSAVGRVARRRSKRKHAYAYAYIEEGGGGREGGR